MTRAPWRSLLYVPANNDRFLAKAHERDADGVILDLEDGVPPAEKAAARAKAAAAVAALKGAPCDVLVRINPGLRLAVPDLEAVVRDGLAAILLPKCESPGLVVALAGTIAELEAERGLPPGRIGLVALIESPRALARAAEIAAAHPRVVALMLGSEDFATACGMAPDPEVLLGPRQQIVLAARAAGVTPLGLLESVAAIDDLERLGAIAVRSRRFGFEGATCVHPAVVPILNGGFSPSEAEIAEARRIVAAMRAAEAEGSGAVRLDGRMIDAPVVARARQTLARACTRSDAADPAGRAADAG